MPSLGPIHIAQEKFEYAGVLLRLSLSSTPIRHKNEAFRERCFEPKEFKNVAFSFLCAQKTFCKRSFLRR